MKKVAGQYTQAVQLTICGFVGVVYDFSRFLSSMVEKVLMNSLEATQEKILFLCSDLDRVLGLGKESVQDDKSIT